MSNDYKASPLSDQQIEEIVLSTKNYLRLPKEAMPDVAEILTRGEIQTRHGIKKLSLKLVPDGANCKEMKRTRSRPRIK